MFNVLVVVVSYEFGAIMDVDSQPRNASEKKADIE
jgi:hypothetical protein